MDATRCVPSTRCKAIVKFQVNVRTATTGPTSHVLYMLSEPLWRICRSIIVYQIFISSFWIQDQSGDSVSWPGASRGRYKLVLCSCSKGLPACSSSTFMDCIYTILLHASPCQRLVYLEEKEYNVQDYLEFHACGDHIKARANPALDSLYLIFMRNRENIMIYNSFVQRVSITL